ncbi:hypothetical protein BRARA_H00507 [Brassica rapa]|uniref:Small EDRK-rich factor-like N-terminal domain-containing protein n=1 Tax=Brassica campestris TaxID=3711 RepID=A0A397Y9Z3_BRACM|nr:hypothetical protein BRARA_H00507 [Brassica rapa]
MGLKQSLVIWHKKTFIVSLRVSSYISYLQRERDRERAQARGNHKPKQPKNDGLTPEQRRERDARALQEKAARKAGQSMGEGNHDHFLCVGGKIKN